jgi:hypothetical protein
MPMIERAEAVNAAASALIFIVMFIAFSAPWFIHAAHRGKLLALTNHRACPKLPLPAFQAFQLVFDAKLFHFQAHDFEIIRPRQR